MARTLLVFSAGDGVGLARTCLGVLRALDRRGVHVAFVKPVAQPRPDGGRDRSTALVTATTALYPRIRSPAPRSSTGSGPADSTPCWSRSLLHGSRCMSDQTLSLSRGSVHARPRCTLANLNRALAAALDAEVVLVASWPAGNPRGCEDRADGVADPARDPVAGTVDGLAESLAVTADAYSAGENARVVGCVVNGLPETEPSAAIQFGEALRPAWAAPDRSGVASARADLVAGVRPCPRAGSARVPIG